MEKEEIAKELLKTYRKAFLNLQNACFEMRDKFYKLEKEIEKIPEEQIIFEILNAWAKLEEFSDKILELACDVGEFYSDLKDFCKEELGVKA